MSGTEGKTDVQLPHSAAVVGLSGITLPLGDTLVTARHQLPHWSRVDGLDYSLKPFQRDRLQRLPLPPSIVPTTEMAEQLSSLSLTVTLHEEGLGVGMNPLQKIQQLEKSLGFVKEQHAALLHTLHEEIDELKRKNRDLQFQLVVTHPNAMADNLEEKKVQKVPVEVQVKLEKLEKEVRKLRNALRDALKTNSSLNAQLERMKREHYMNTSGSSTLGYTCPVVEPHHCMHDGRQRALTAAGPSGHLEHRGLGSTRGIRAHDMTEQMGGEWGSSYLENKRRFSEHSDQQPHLPRLSLRNQHLPQQQCKLQYRQRSSNSLPALKQQAVSLVERGEKHRKSRGSSRNGLGSGSMSHN